MKTLLDMCKEEPNNDDSESKKEIIVAVLKGNSHSAFRVDKNDNCRLRCQCEKRCVWELIV